MDQVLERRITRVQFQEKAPPSSKTESGHTSIVSPSLSANSDELDRSSIDPNADRSDESDNSDAEMNKFQSTATSALRSEFATSKQSKTVQSIYDDEHQPTRRQLDREIIQVKAYEVRLQQLKSQWDQLEAEIGVVSDIKKNAIEGHGILSAQEKWKQEIERIALDNQLYKHLKKRTNKSKARTKEQSIVLKRYIDRLDKRIELSRELTKSAVRETEVCERDFNFLSKNLEKSQKTRMNKLKKRWLLVEDQQTETNEEVQLLVRRQYSQSKSEKQFETNKARNQERDEIKNTRIMEKSLKYFTTARIDSEKSKIINYFGSFDFGEICNKIHAINNQDTILTQEVDQKLLELNDKEQELNNLSTYFNEYRQTTQNDISRQQILKRQKADIYFERPCRSQNSARSKLQTTMTKLEFLQYIVFRATAGLLQLMDLVKEKEEEVKYELFGSKLVAWGKIAQLNNDSLNRNGMIGLEIQDLDHLFKMLAKKLVTANTIATTRHKWLLSKEKIQPVIENTVRRKMSILVKRQMKSKQSPLPLGAEEFTRHFLTPRDVRRFSTVTRANVVASDLVKDYSRMQAAIKVGFDLAKSSVIVRSTGKKLKQGFTHRFQFNPQIENDNEEFDHMREERRMCKTTRSLGSRSTRRITAMQQDIQDYFEANTNWEGRTQKEINKLDRNMNKLNAETARMRQKAKYRPLKNFAKEASDQKKHLAKFRLYESTREKEATLISTSKSSTVTASTKAIQRKKHSLSTAKTLGRISIKRKL